MLNTFFMAYTIRVGIKELLKYFKPENDIVQQSLFSFRV